MRMQLRTISTDLAQLILKMSIAEWITVPVYSLPPIETGIVQIFIYLVLFVLVCALINL